MKKAKLAAVIAFLALLANGPSRARAEEEPKKESHEAASSEGGGATNPCPTGPVEVQIDHSRARAAQEFCAAKKGCKVQSVNFVERIGTKNVLSVECSLEPSYRTH